MPADWTLAKSYTDNMKPLGHGHGFYETESASKVRRGMCGYIDGTGTWRHVVDLTNRREMDAGGYTSPGHLVEATPRRDEWREVTSEGVAAIKSELQLGGDAGVVGTHIRFVLDASRASGAALICNSPVYRDGFEYEGPLRNWARKNAARVAKNRPEVKTYGFYLVQTTWASEDVWINAWRGERTEVSIGFSIRAVDAAGASPELQYTHERSVGRWVHPLPPDTGDPERVVLFFKGLQFHIRVAVAGKAWVHETRGQDDGERFRVADPDDATLEYEVDCFRVGQDGESDGDSDGPD